MKKPHLQTQQGLSLIEILIAMVIGVFLMAGIIQIFISSKETYRTQEGLSRLQENGRFAMEFLARDIRMTDFLGCLKNGLDSVAITNNLNPSGTGYTTGVHDFPAGLLGADGGSGANAAVDPPDSISLSGAIGSIAIEAPFGPQANANIKITAGNDLLQGDIVLVADCTQGDIFQISNANPSTGGLAVHNTGSVTEPGNYNPGTCGSGHCLSKVYRDDANIYKIATNIFSIQNGAGGQPALFKQVNGGTPVEIVEGIENMQILYGVDTDNPSDNTANFYIPASSLVAAPGTPNMNQVVSVRISILARTVSEVANLANQPIPFTYNGATTTPTDRQLRRVFTSTFTLRNRLN